jgi:hypothetical protein
MEHLASGLINSVNVEPEDEHVFFPYLLSNLNISTVHSTNNETSIHDEFHVWSSWGFCASSRDVLREFSSWNDCLSRWNVVIRKEDKF